MTKRTNKVGVDETPTLIEKPDEQFSDNVTKGLRQDNIMIYSELVTVNDFKMPTVMGKDGEEFNIEDAINGYDASVGVYVIVDGEERVRNISKESAFDLQESLKKSGKKLKYVGR